MKISDTLQNLLNFVSFTQKFREVERNIMFAKERRHENDSEHSFQLALVSWYIISSQKLNLNIESVMQYALAHDLAEIYAGDTPMNSTNQEYVNSKHEREAEALKQISKEFSEFPELIDIIARYEKRGDEESKFVYALDKILPPLNIYLEQGYSWKIKNIPLQKVIDHKKEKIAVSPDIQKIGDELIELLQSEEKKLFNNFPKIK